MAEVAELARLISRLNSLRCPIQAIFYDHNVCVRPCHERLLLIDWLLNLYALRFDILFLEISLARTV